MKHLDDQLKEWSTHLKDHLNILPPESDSVASNIASEVGSLSVDAKQRVKSASPIPLNARIEELVAFQQWMSLVVKSGAKGAVVRAQVIVQNYICFVYLGDACFNVLKRELAAGSVGRKCCKFLTDNPIRSFRNAIAHSNWQYLPDFSGLEYWARKSDNPNEALVRFTVLQEDLSFWQTLARCTAYASYITLLDPAHSKIGGDSHRIM